MIFFLGVCAFYLLVIFFSPENIINSLINTSSILIKILPVLFVVVVLLIISNYFADSKFIIKHLKAKGIKGWIYSIVGGIVSVGPIYAWYPLLSDLKDSGVRVAYLSCFLYARSIKPALFPVFILYFGFVYFIILTIVVLVFSVLQGLLLEYFSKNFNNDNPLEV